MPFFLHWPAGNLARGRDVDTLTAHVDVLTDVDRSVRNRSAPKMSNLMEPIISPLIC